MSAAAVGVMIGSIAMIALAVTLGLYQWHWCEEHRIPRTIGAVAAGVLMVISSLLTVNSAYRLDTVSEPTPDSWPTETPYPCYALRDILDTMRVNQEQILHHAESIPTIVALLGTSAPILGTPTVIPTVIPTSMPTPTATPAILCKRCEYESDCGPGYRCVRCSDMRSRCVRLDSPNGDCQNCVNQELGR